MIDEQCRDVVIDGNTFRRNPVQFVPRANKELANIVFKGNVVYAEGANAIQLYDAADGSTQNNIDISSNVLRGMTGVPIYVGSGWTNKKIHHNIGYVTENSGTATNAINATWVSHGLAGTPTTVTLTINGSNYINSTCYLLQPTVIASNSTHFQIGFYISNTETITAVTTTDQRNIMWTAEYKP